MGRLSIKTVCKGTALLIFVILQGLNAETATTSTSTLSTESQTTAPATTSSPSTESQTSAPSTPATTSSSSTESQTSAPTTPATISSLSTESQTSAPSTPATTSSSSTESQTSAPTTPATISSLSTESQTSAPSTPATTSSPSTKSETSAPSTPATTSSPSTKSETSAPSKPDVIMNLTADDITTSSVLLNWIKPNGQSSHYRVEYEDKNVIAENTSIKINDLIPGAQYTFRVFAVAADNETKGRANQISLYTKPDVIKNFTVSKITTSSVFLTWAEPFGNRSFFKLNWTDENLDLNRKAVETNNTSYHITGLNAGVNYTFCITAAAADQSTEGETLCISNYTRPNVASNLTVSEITPSSVFLTWEEPLGNRSFFKIQWTSDKTNGSSTTNNTSYNITGLTAGVNYTFIITAVAADRSTEGGSVVTSKYTKPDVIMNLTADDITTSSVLLNWIKPNGQSSHYRVEYEDTIVITEKTSIKINDLIPGAQYTFRVFAVAADNETKGRANQISLYTKPDVIMNFTVSTITTSSVFLTWAEPFGNRSFFKLNWTDENLDLNRKAVETNNTSYHITGLNAGVNYTFCITAVAADQSTEGETLCISNYTKPGVIRNLTVNNITTSSVFLTWNEPGGNRDFFKIQWTDEKTNRNSTTNTSYHITGLNAGVNYTFCITAVAADQATEGETVCISNYTKPDVIRNLSVNNITTSSVFLTWNEPGGNRDFFKIQWTDEKTNRNSTTNTSYHITGLNAGVNYTFCITAVAADQATEGETVCISNYTKPNMIINLTVSEITPSSVFLTWEEPVGHRSFFKIQWTGDKTNANSTTSNTSYHITGLTAGVNYTFIITAVAADRSTEGESVVTSKYTKPDVIMNLTADNITTSSVLLNWIKPNGQSSHYRVEYEDTNVITEKTSIKIIDLIPGAQYTFRVFAVAADNETKGRANQISLYTKPDVIKNFTLSKITTSSVFLTWAEPFGNRSFFKLNWTDENLDLNRNAVETNNTSYNITDLKAGVKYTFCITAAAADQSTEGETLCISKYTRPNVASNLTVSEITPSSVFLTWEEPVGHRSFFKIQWADDKTDATTNTSHQITGLTAGVNYTFCITAVAADQSTEGETVCSSQFTKPNMIINLTVSEITPSSVFLKWDEPFGNRSFFKIQWTDDKTNGSSTTNNTSYNITGLNAGVNYTFIITAVAADQSTEGESLCLSKFTKPNMIINLTVSEITPSSVFLTWKEPFGNRSFFKIQWTDDKTNGSSTTNNTSYNITGLTAGVNYTFIITAVAADRSTEGESAVTSKYTKPNMIINLKVSEITTSSVFLTWEEPVGNRSFFKIQWTGYKINGSSTTNNTSYNITGLTAGVNYTFIITAVAADRLTEGETVCISQFTKPDVITNLRVNNTTTSSVFLTWNEPLGNRSFFKIQWTSHKTNANSTTNNTSYNITGLTAGVNYTFIITAVAADRSTEGESVVTSKYT
uniref:Fibronectin type-III domain-containing protein n=1 Tax=Cyprinus carpio carpio TaxID=630221 RepID=A0A9J8B9Q8_CYPCA